MLRRNGSVLEVSSDGELGASLDGFSILRGVPRNLDDIRALGLGKELLLKVNPNIVVDVEVTAGSLNTERVPHLGKVRVTAGGAKLLDVTEINDALIQAGLGHHQGRDQDRPQPDPRRVRLAVDHAGRRLERHRDAATPSWARSAGAGGHTGAGDEVVMGNGSARLDVEVVMGHAQVRVGSDPVAEGAGA